MRRALVGFAAVWLWLAPQGAFAGETIRDVISAQLAAFAQSDWVAAYAFASPTIQAKFPDPEAFAAMVVGAYPVIAQHDKALILEAVGSGSMRYQMVTFVDEAQGTHSYFYQMVKIDGTWRINGVFEHPNSGSGA